MQRKETKQLTQTETTLTIKTRLIKRTREQEILEVALKTR